MAGGIACNRLKRAAAATAMSLLPASDLVASLARMVMENQTGIVRACAYIVRRVKAVSRFARARARGGEVFAMYVRSLDQTWACVLGAEADGTLSARLVACEGFALDRLADLAAAEARVAAFAIIADQVVDGGLSRSVCRAERANAGFVRMLDKYVPAAALDAAVAMDDSDAHFRRWRMSGSEERERADAMHVCAVDQTWAVVTRAGEARLVVLRGNHLDRLDLVHGGRLAGVTTLVVTDFGVTGGTPPRAA